MSGRDPLEILAKVIAAGNGLTPGKTAPPHRWTRGVVQTVNGDGTAGIFIDGGSTLVQADIVGPQNLAATMVCEVLVAGNRLIIMGVISGAEAGIPSEMYDIGGAGPTVGTLPTTGIRSVSITWVGACVTGFGLSIVTIDLTVLTPNLTTGYNVVSVSGDASTTAVEATPLAGSSSLTSLELAVATGAGAALPNGTTVRVNLFLTGA